LLTFSMQLWKRNSKTLIDFDPERICIFRRNFKTFFVKNPY
jgi:hypothetical protein